jgi:hypothetical protein
LNTSKEHINVNVLKFHLNHRHESFTDLRHLSDVWIRLQHRGQNAKEMLIAFNVPRGNTQGIDVRARPIHSETVGTECKDFAARLVDCILIFAIAFSTRLYPLLNNGIKLSQNFFLFILLCLGLVLAKVDA